VKKPQGSARPLQTLRGSQYNFDTTNPLGILLKKILVLYSACSVTEPNSQLHFEYFAPDLLNTEKWEQSKNVAMMMMIIVIMMSSNNKE
jgi:predicted component of type VI protein secretion system